MILASDLRDGNGRFILAKGTKLMPKHLRIFKIWGVVEAEIEGTTCADQEASGPSEIDPAVMKEAKAAVADRFCKTNPKEPAISELIRFCIPRKARQISEGLEEAFPTPPERAPQQSDLTENRHPKGTKLDPRLLIDNDIKLPSLPNIFVELNEAIKKPRSSANDIADVISKDTSLSARLLKIVNNPFYGFPSRIDTLSRAVAIVGTKQLTTLSLGISIVSMFKDIPSDFIDMKGFWKHSVCCGIMARILASHKKTPNTERLFVAGLIHDIGRLIIYNHLSTYAREALITAALEKSLLRKAETQKMGFDHAEMGAILLKKWGLPPLLEQVVAFHHAPHKSHTSLEPAIVHTADIVANAIEIGSSGERFVPPLEPSAWKSLGLSVNVLPVAISQTFRQVNEITSLICSDEE
jgi:HD-like signal output (HDOD) protein